MELTQIQAFLLSTLTEAAVGAGLLALTRKAAVWRGVGAAVLGTALTHPVLWAVFSAIESRTGYWPALAMLEALVVLAEAGVWRIIALPQWRSALLFSLAANVSSFAAGLFIQGW